MTCEESDQVWQWIKHHTLLFEHEQESFFWYLVEHNYHPSVDTLMAWSAECVPDDYS